jgi:hypothetical protein
MEPKFAAEQTCPPPDPAGQHPQAAPESPAAERWTAVPDREAETG